MSSGVNGGRNDVESIWENLRARFSDLSQIIRYQLETKDEAIGKKIPVPKGKESEDKFWALRRALLRLWENSAQSLIIKLDTEGETDWIALDGRAKGSLVKLTKGEGTIAVEFDDETNEGLKFGEQWVSTGPTSFDPDIGFEVRSEFTIPYIDTIDQEELHNCIERARAIRPALIDHFNRADVSIEFLNDWGEFCSAAAVVEFIHLSNSDVGRARTAKAGGEGASKDAQRRWFANYFLKVHRGYGTRAEAEDAVERLIKSVIDGSTPIPQSYSVEWFRSFLTGDTSSPDPAFESLREAYRDNELSVKEMKRLAKLATDDLPPLDLRIPNIQNQGP